MGSANSGALGGVFIVLWDISIYFSCMDVCFVGSCLGGWCAPWLSELLWAVLLWRWVLGGGRRCGCSLPDIVVLNVLFLFWCLVLDILVYCAVVYSAPGVVVVVSRSMLFKLCVVKFFLGGGQSFFGECEGFELGLMYFLK